MLAGKRLSAWRTEHQVHHEGDGMNDATENTRVQSWIPTEWETRIEEELDYGDSISEWVREAIELKLTLKNDTELSSQVDHDGE